LPRATSLSNFRRQPRAVWAVAFTCVIAFMGLGLVDPILPGLAKDLHASQSQVELLFSSYTLSMGIAMLVTSTVSSWLGAKRTLIGGLILIIAFSFAAGSSNSIAEIVGFRAGWGLGNALFVATALAVIVGAASGGITSSVILYEAAIGVGIATGPVVGGILGGISWRGPFYGVSCLMVVALLATAFTLPKTAVPARRVSIIEPLRALRHRGLATMGTTAFFYNFGFFTLLAYSPFPMGLDAHGLGLVFLAWGVGVALTSVFVAPRLQARFGTVQTTYVVLGSIALILLIAGIFTSSRTVLIIDVIASGLFLGVNNTLITQAVMKVSDVERPVASAGYSFVRFIGGSIAPYLAGRLAEAYSPHVPFFFGAAMVGVAVVVLYLGRKQLSAVDAPETSAEHQEVIIGELEAAAGA
jgi:MFS transporter, ACDE family, multidrug resistance protein